MKQELQFFSNAKLPLAVLSIGYIVCGSIFLFIPQISVNQFCFAIGVLLLIAGPILLALFLLRKSYRYPNRFGLLWGLFSFVLGLYITINTNEVTRILTLLLGFAILLDSGLKLEFSFALFRNSQKKWWMIAIIGALTMILATIILINPFSDDIVRNLFTYWVLLVDGILNILLLLLFHFLFRD